MNPARKFKLRREYLYINNFLIYIMNIRKFKEGDAIGVSNIIKKCLVEVNSKDYSKKVISFMCSYFTPALIIKTSKKMLIFVAVDNKHVLGTASLKKNEISTIFVDPKVHGRGVGKNLMKRVESEANKNGFKSIKLFSSITAIKFYKKLGYYKVKANFDKNFGKTILMKKAL